MSYVELMLDQGEITPIDWAGKKMFFDIFKADDHINIMNILYRDFTGWYLYFDRVPREWVIWVPVLWRLIQPALQVTQQEHPLSIHFLQWRTLRYLISALSEI